MASLPEEILVPRTPPNTANNSPATSPVKPVVHSAAGAAAVNYFNAHAVDISSKLSGEVHQAREVKPKCVKRLNFNAGAGAGAGS